ncbi:hypothetical protein [Rahnella sp. PAMC 25559]|uniref:hypothetical protein n=1 Tax=Rahnella sp. PAMC 25559 TaxID=3423225 RepID=UPI003D6689C2
MKSYHYSVSALALALFTFSGSTVAGALISSTNNALTQFRVVSASQASVTVNARKDLAAGSVPNQFKVGDWNGSVTAGTLAVRVNRTLNAVNPDYNSKGSGVSTDTSVVNSKNQLKFQLMVERTIPQQVIGDWIVFEQGTTSMISTITTTSAQVLAAGRYPIGVELAAWAF